MVGAIKKKVDLPGDTELVERWEKILDPAKTPIKKFVELYKVPFKRGGGGLSLTGRTMVNFKEYKFQAEIREAVERQWKRNEGGKQMIGKPRQEGISTLCALLFWERFMRGGGGTWNLFSYDTDAVKELFRLVWSFRKQTPAFVFDHLVKSAQGSKGATWKRKSGTQLQIDFEDGSYSLLQCLTAGDKHSGSGSAPRGLLWDEFSKWAPEVKQDPTAMSEGWQDAPGCIWLIPSTGQGQEAFSEMFLETWEGRSVSGFEARFSTWLGHPDRHVDFQSPQEKTALIDTVGQEAKFGAKDEMDLVAAGATPEELWWRRRKIASPGIRGDLTLFRREYPNNVSDMFTSSSRSVFHGHIEILKSHEKPAKFREQKARVGYFRYKGKDVVFVDEPFGPWVLFETRDDQSFYCFGADSTSGKQRLAWASKTSGMEPDFAVGMFAEVYTGRTVARYRAHTEGRKFAEELFLGSCYFRGRDLCGAPGMVERNTFGEVVCYRLGELEFGQIGGDAILMRMPVHAMSAAVQVTETIGFHKNVRTSEIMIDAVRDFLDEVPVWQEGTETPFCGIFPTEALLYERDPKSGKPSAARGHDDCVAAESLMLIAREQLLESGAVPRESRVRFGQKLDPIEEFQLGRTMRKKGGKYGGGTSMVDILGAGF